MIVVQHYSLVELRKLYELADQEARSEPQSPLLDDPPPSYDTYRALEQGLPLEPAHDDKQISLHVPTEPPNLENSSQAIVKYQERPIQQLDASFNQALARENHVMNADVPDIVEHLLSQWTRMPEIQSHSSPLRDSPRDIRRKSYYESDTDDTSDSEFEGALTGGRYLEAPPRRSHKGKVQFRARVESDPEDAVREKPRQRGPSKHVLQQSGESDTSSDSDSGPPPSRTRPAPRRGSDASSHHSDTYDRARRPYMSGGLSNVPEDASGSRNPSRGIPPSPMPVPIRPMPTPNQQWPPTPQGTPSNPGFRAPSFNAPYPGSPRIQTNGPYAPPPAVNGHYPQPTVYMPGPSPQLQTGTYFPQRMQNMQQGPPPLMPQQQQRPPRHRRQHRHEDRESIKLQREREKAQKAEDSSKNLKRGLFGGAALAGVLDLLQGLDGI